MKRLSVVCANVYKYPHDFSAPSWKVGVIDWINVCLRKLRHYRTTSFFTERSDVWLRAAREYRGENGFFIIILLGFVAGNRDAGSRQHLGKGELRAGPPDRRLTGDKARLLDPHDADPIALVAAQDVEVRCILAEREGQVTTAGASETHDRANARLHLLTERLRRRSTYGDLGKGNGRYTVGEAMCDEYDAPGTLSAL